MPSFRASASHILREQKAWSCARNSLTWCQKKARRGGEGDRWLSVWKEGSLQTPVVGLVASVAAAAHATPRVRNANTPPAVANLVDHPAFAAEIHKGINLIEGENAWLRLISAGERALQIT